MGKLKSRDTKLLNNLTILDFADSPKSCKRLPKNKFCTKEVIQPNHTDDHSINTDFDEEITSVGASERAKKQLVSQNPDHVYNDFHVDIWFLISEYIPPEDICRFALICQKTRYIVSSAKFWAHLYRKYYNSDVKLPECLQPEYICRSDGYRSSVIRSLFYMYPPFALERMKATPNPEHLLKFKCIGSWFRPVKTTWMLCYKFSRKNATASYDRSEALEDWEVADSWEDIDPFAPATVRKAKRHTEEGNRLLVVKTDRFYQPPDFLSPNLHLSKIIQPISQDLRAYKLELTFSEYTGRTVGVVTYDPVISIKILKWWEPEYYSYLG